MHFLKLTERSFLIQCFCFFLMAGFVGTVFMDSFKEVQARTSLPHSTHPDSFSGLVKKAKPAVVYISTVKVIKGKSRFQSPFGGNMHPNDQLRDFFDQFLGRRAPRDYKQEGLGSGFVIDKDGYILTNNHVVEKVDEIKVTMADKKTYTAELIGHDPKTDLALIRIDADEALEPLPLGNSDDLEVGDWVVAIGNPYGLGNTVTAGIVSYKSRNINAGPYDDFIQTDAAINPGNSGGPLLNTKGEVVGINSAIFSQTGGSIGIGFAIPVNMAKDLLPQLKKGKVIRGWLGVHIQQISPELKDGLKLKDTKGALVADVSPGSPAQKAGIKRGDVVVSFDGTKIEEMDDLPYAVASTPVGKEVVVKVIRKGKTKSFDIKVGELKDEEAVEEGGEPEFNLGMIVEELTPQLARQFDLSETAGVVVVQVERGSAAADAGLRPGDLIVEIDQSSVRDLSDFYDKIHEMKKGVTVPFLVKRGPYTLYLTLKVEE